MKLAEALVLRADLKKRLAQMRLRLMVSAVVQEGDTPPEEPQVLLNELAVLLEGFEQLIVNINRTNMTATTADGLTLTAALARRDALDLELSVLGGLLEAASNRVDRHAHSEIKVLSTVAITPLRQRIDALSKTRRELDSQIQGANWTTQLQE